MSAIALATDLVFYDDIVRTLEYDHSAVTGYRITKLGKVVRPIVRQYERLCAAQVDPRLH